MNNEIQFGKQEYDVPEMMRLAKKILDSRIIPSCLTCGHFAEGPDQCTLYKLRPPARIIAYGCESWKNTSMPF